MRARTQRWGSWETGFGGGVGLLVDVPYNGDAYPTIYGRNLPNQQVTPPGLYQDLTNANFTSRYRYDPSGSCPIGTTTVTGGTVVNATIAANCNVSASNLNFGSAAQLTAAVNAASTVSVQCTNTTPYSVALSGGGEANVSARKMASGANKISYQLYRDTARTLIWGNTTSDDVNGTGTGFGQPVTVYGRVPPQTTPIAASYSDTIVVTVTY